MEATVACIPDKASRYENRGVVVRLLTRDADTPLVCREFHGETGIAPEIFAKKTEL